MSIKVCVEQMKVIVDLDKNLSNKELVNLMMDGFSEILKHDLRVSQIICSNETKQIISKILSKETGYSFDDSLCGAKYINNETAEYLKFILTSELPKTDISSLLL